MKWLKLFETFTQEEYYKEVTILEYFEHFNKLVRFDPIELKKITSMMSEDYNGICGDARVRYYSNMNDDLTGMAHQLMIKPYEWGDTFSYFIYKKYDDWYMVEEIPVMTAGNYAYNSSRYYLCDQFEGLVRLLKDKGVFKK
jgi:hypothetical protein